MLFKKDPPYMDFDGGSGTIVDIPDSYAQRQVWVPGIGDVFADFQADTTHGEVNFHAWAKGQWTLFFAHPQAFSPVCATEVAELAAAQDSFDKRGVRILGMSQSDPQTQQTWIEDVQSTFDVEVNFPFVSDERNKLAAAFGMLHPNSLRPLPVRKTFILDPQMRIRIIFEYPNSIGRNTDEILRVLDAMQIADAEGLYAPSNWKSGKTMLVQPTMSDEEACENYGQKWSRVNEYIRVAPST